MYRYSKIDSAFIQRLIKETNYKDRQKIKDLILIWRDLREENVGWLSGMGLHHLKQHYKKRV